MKICSLCGKRIHIDGHFSRKSSCPQCGGDLHICLNCKFYSEKSHNSCLEPRSDYQRMRDKANFCDWFVFRESPAVSTGAQKEDALKTLENLFRKS